MEMIHDLNFDIAPDLWNKWNNDKEDVSWKDIEISDEYNYLFDYQKDALRFAEYHNNKAIFAMRMGEGKTVTSLSFMDKVELFPVLIIAPSIAKQIWYREYYKFINKNDTIKIIESSREMLNFKDEIDIVIINYELISRHIIKDGETFYPDKTLKGFNENRFRMLVIDELHKIKNPNAKITHGVQYLSKGCSSILGLTGTPLLNSSENLYTSLNIFLPEEFSNYYRFCNRFCNIRTNYGAGKKKEYYGVRNSVELHQILRNRIMYRHEIVEDTDKVPITTMIPIRMDSIKKYKSIEKDSDNEGFAILDKLKKEAWEQKKRTIFETIEELLEETDEKMLVFCHNKFVIDAFMEKFNKISVKIDGSVSTKGDTRYKIIDRFTKDPKIRLLLGSITAIGTATDGLQYASNIGIFVQWTWNFSDIDQSIARLYRKGQTKRVHIYHFPAQDSIEELFLSILDRKAKMAREVIDCEIMDEKQTLRYLLEKVKRENNGE